MSKESETSDVPTPDSDRSVETKIEKTAEESDLSAKTSVKTEAVKFSKGSSKAGKTPAPSSKF
jgi:hypothetical protein